MVPEIKQYEKYLGLPIVVGKNRRASLNYIKDGVWGKLQGWREIVVSSLKRSVAKGGCSSHTHFCNGML